MFETLRRAFRLPELRNRILFTLMMFIVIRLGTYIPVPGIDRAAVAELVGKGGFLGLLDLFSGGGIANFAIFSLSVLPYINASIIIELLGSVIPALEELRKEGGKEGQRKIAKYTRYLTLGLAIIESFGVVAIFQKYLSSTGFFVKLLGGEGGSVNPVFSDPPAGHDDPVPRSGLFFVGRLPQNRPRHDPAGAAVNKRLPQKTFVKNDRPV